MTSKFKGFVSKLQQDFIAICSTYYFIHRDVLMIKTITNELKIVLGLVIKMVSYIKSRALKLEFSKTCMKKQVLVMNF